MLPIFRAALCLTALLWVSGCASQKIASRPVSTLGPARVEVAAEEVVPLTPAAPPEPLVEFLLPRTGREWISLDEWGALAGHPRAVTGPNPGQALLAHSNGTVELKAGNQIAVFRGLAVWLGFAPRLHQGKLFLHYLDVQKTLEPLLRSHKNPQPHAMERGTSSSPLETRGQNVPNSTLPMVLVLDPGHGGTDSGTQGIHPRLEEKNFTLDWALRLERLLSSNGWKVVLTRTNDSEISLSNRVALAEKAGATLFVSLHFNSFSRPEMEGLETYCLTPAGVASHLTRGYEDNPALYFPNNQFDADNVRLAAALHGQLIKLPGIKDRGIRRARFMTVLRGQKCPAVLLEGGYLSNPREAGLIASSNYREKLAEAVAKGLSSLAPLLAPVSSGRSISQISHHPESGGPGPSGSRFK